MKPIEWKHGGIRLGNVAARLRGIFLCIASLYCLPSMGAVINHVEWYQPADLMGYSWNDFNAVCAGGPCGGRLSLTGPDLTGWTWATPDDVNALFNSFIYAREGIQPLGPGPSSYWELGDSVPMTESFVWDALTVFDPTSNFPAWVSGWLSVDAEEGPQYGEIATIGHEPILIPEGILFADTGDEFGPVSKSNNSGGAWLYRQPGGIPVPSSLALLALGAILLALKVRGNSTIY